MPNMNILEKIGYALQGNKGAEVLRQNDLQDAIAMLSQKGLTPQQFYGHLTQLTGDPNIASQFIKQNALSQLALEDQNAPIGQQIARREALGLLTPAEAMERQGVVSNQSALLKLREAEAQREQEMQNARLNLLQQQQQEQARHNLATEQQKQGFNPVTGEVMRPQTPIEKEMAKQDAKRISSLSNEADQAQGIIDLGNQFMAAQEGVLLQGKGVGWLPSFSEAAQTADSVAEQMRLIFTQLTKGAISDYEMRSFEKASPSLNKEKGSNRNIIDNMASVARRKQEQQAFFDTWIQQHGTLRDADKAWRNYVNENPLIDPKKSIEEQKARMPEAGEWAPYLNKGYTKEGANKGQGKSSSEKVMTLQDVQNTAQSSGRSIQDVISAAKSKGYTIK